MMQCNECGREFAKAYNLRHHQQELCEVTCNDCGKSFSTRSNLLRHLRTICQNKNPQKKSKVMEEYQCSRCKKQFSAAYQLRNHRNDGCHPTYVCTKCNKQFVNRSNLLRHQRTTCDEGRVISKKRLRPVDVEVLQDGVSKLTHAFKNRIASYRFKSSKKYIDYCQFLNEIKPKVISKINEYLRIYNNLKINTEAFGTYVQPESEIYDVKSMNTSNKIITQSSNLNQVYEEFKDEIQNQASEFEGKLSGWSLQEILFLDLNINKFVSINASSYIKLPTSIAKKGAVLNIKNNDDKCFAYCINAAIFPADGDPKKPTSYPPIDTLLKFDNIEFPITLKDIARFEKLNNISINVFGLEKLFKDGKNIYEVVGPLHFTSERKPTHVNLLLLTDVMENNHYCLITNLSRLVSKQKSKHDGRLYFCDGCLQAFNTFKKLKAHESNDCTHIYSVLPTTDLKKNKCGECLPENILKFTNYEKQMAIPFVIYADFESLLVPIAHNEPSTEQSFGVKVCQHKPYSFAFYVKCSYDQSLSTFEIYRGPDAAKVFVEKLDQTVQHLYHTHLKHNIPMKLLTKEEKNRHESAMVCFLCEKPFQTSNPKVRDHCHLTGLYRGPAHNSCNLNYKITKTIPVFFHNLTNYDCHLFIKELAAKGERISAIAQTKEKYISFSKFIQVDTPINDDDQGAYIQLRFVDSYRFLARPLDLLAKSLDESQCVEVRKYFPEEEKFNKMREKGVFPYSYIDSFEKFKETELPSREQFFDKLKNEEISDNEYNKAVNVWETFNCQTLGDYSDLYLTADVLLLADVFENFRNVCFREYNLDPAHYLTAPSLSWDAMLRITKQELQLLTDIDMLHFFKKGIRGGVAQCSKRMAVANNKFLPTYDPSKPTSYIAYLDATNLYGSAMNQNLPYGDFRWLSKHEIANFQVNLVSKTSEKGFVIEADLEYPTSIHDDHNDLPFCPENIVPPNSKHSKLIPNLYNKSKYIIHYHNLQQCLKYGLKLKKIHRVLEFSQKPWLKPYVELNTSLRNQAKNEFERDLFKLLINAIFGKTMENVEKRKDIHLCTRWESYKNSPGARSLIAKPQFHTRVVFDENLTAVQLNPVKVVYEKPLYAGFAILDISKTIIYDFLYGYIKRMYGDAAKLCYTDTDSLVLEIFTDNFYEDIKNNIDLFDTSNYSENNIYSIPKTESIVGKMKDEFGGVPIQSFTGTGAKAYCVKLNQPIKGYDEIKKAKGVSKHVIKTQLEMNDYVRTVEDGTNIFRKMFFFVSDKHTIYTELRNKVALNSKDDKRYVIPGDVNTLSWGHFLLTSKKHSGNLDDLLDASKEVAKEDKIDVDLNVNNLDDFNLNDLNLDVNYIDLDMLNVDELENLNLDVNNFNIDLSELDLDVFNEFTI